MTGVLTNPNEATGEHESPRGSARAKKRELERRALLSKKEISERFVAETPEEPVWSDAVASYELPAEVRRDWRKELLAKLPDRQKLVAGALGAVLFVGILLYAILAYPRFFGPLPGILHGISDRIQGEIDAAFRAVKRAARDLALYCLFWGYVFGNQNKKNGAAASSKGGSNKPPKRIVRI